MGSEAGCRCQSMAGANECDGARTPAARLPDQRSPATIQAGLTQPLPACHSTAAVTATSALHHPSSPHLRILLDLQVWSPVRQRLLATGIAGAQLRVLALPLACGGCGPGRGGEHQQAKHPGRAAPLAWRSTHTSLPSSQSGSIMHRQRAALKPVGGSACAYSLCSPSYLWAMEWGSTSKPTMRARSVSASCSLLGDEPIRGVQGCGAASRQRAG